MTGTCQDVTDRRTAEEQLRLAHKMESVGRLAGGVAHEANNQMSVVMSAADFILARPDLPPAVRADAEYIRRAAERTAAVTAQLLAFSRRQVLRPQVLDLNAVLEQFRPVLQRTLGEDCPVTLLLDPALGPVRADPGQLEQVLLNLAINARDAMPRGGRLSVETAAVELTERSAVLSHGVARPAGTVRPARRERHRPRHGQGDAGPRLRAVLHHQGRRPGHRARARDGLRHREAVGRLRVGLQRARPGNDDQALPAGDARTTEAAAKETRGADAAAGASWCSWWRTRRRCGRSPLGH